jgi:hypothetical protein
LAILEARNRTGRRKEVDLARDQVPRESKPRASHTITPSLFFLVQNKHLTTENLKHKEQQEIVPMQP